MYCHLLNTIDKLDSGEIDVFTASAISKLHGQALNYLNYELKRAAACTNPDFKSELRQLELKNFDSLPQ